jgi:hypothetical protein
MRFSDTLVVLAGKLALFATGAYYSFKHCADYWYVGPIFGAVVLIWSANAPRELLNVRAAAFFVASTLIYALVYGVHDELPDGDVSFYLAVGLGTVLLPLAHHVFLGGPRKRMLAAIPLLYALWYAASHALGRLELRGLEKLLNMVSVWQGLYLWLMLKPHRWDGR